MGLVLWAYLDFERIGVPNLYKNDAIQLFSG